MKTAIYIKGSYFYDTQKGEYGAVIIHPDGSRDYISGNEDNSTSCRLELLAIINAIKKLDNDQSVDIYTADNVIISGINNRWMMRNKNRKHMDLWSEILKFGRKHKIQAFRTPSKHTYHIEFAKYLAQEGRKEHIKK